jgi:hypothetical protein
MWRESSAGVARRPESEVEWEDLLVRLELMPRALRIILEELDRGREAVAELLDTLSAREAEARAFLESAVLAAEGLSLSPGGAQVAAVEEDTVDRFVRIRTRNFAIVQRRGIEVWEWEGTGEYAGATVFQLLTGLVRSDVEALATLRRIGKESAGC